MTEREWLEETDVEKLLYFLAGKAAPRKVRLFACTCCRRIARLLPPDILPAVEVAEVYADRRADRRQLAGAHKAVSVHLSGLRGLGKFRTYGDATVWEAGVTAN